MGIDSIPLPGGAVALGAPSDSASRPRDATEAAKQFEALLIAQMLRSAHETDSASLGHDSLDGEDGGSGNSTMLELAEQQLAQILANQGGLGLAKLIVKGLSMPVSPSSTNKR